MRREPDAPLVYRNGYGKPRKLALSNGTITLPRPRVCGLEKRFESRLLLDQVPRKRQAAVRQHLRTMLYAETRAECEHARDRFVKQFRCSYAKTTETLLRDWDRMVAFFDHPKEHWTHLRTTNIVESPFASVRVRTSAAKRYKRVENASALIWKLLRVAEKTFRRLNAPHLLAGVAAGAKYVDGIAVTPHTERIAA